MSKQRTLKTAFQRVCSVSITPRSKHLHFEVLDKVTGMFCGLTMVFINRKTYKQVKTLKVKDVAIGGNLLGNSGAAMMVIEG